MRIQDIDVTNVIDKLKERVETNQIDLLVGSGVSCCACNLYKAWIGLISDMVACLYQEELNKKDIEIICDKNYYCHYNMAYRKDRTNTDYVYDAIKAIVEREGILAIPSQYAKRIGIRESIEAYIESHTPRIDVATNTITLWGETRNIDKEKELYFLTSMVNVGWNAIFTTNYDNLLSYASLDVGQTKFEECCDAALLSLRKMSELIIKLHGSIDFSHERNGFDGDVHRKYVLTQEDYDDYPSKHEAFMQLMRISLLKDCFCLVGFSGTDPNFIAWISWVRDILEAKNTKEPSTFTENDIKIFFIDCFDKPLDKATEQYFENHRIYRIVLPSLQVYSYIKADGMTPKDTDDYRRYILSHFFNYISKNKASEIDTTASKEEKSDANVSQTVSELGYKGTTDNVLSHTISETKSVPDNTYKDIPESNALWSKAYSLTGNFLRESTINVPEAKDLLSLRAHMRIVRSTHYQSYYLDSVKRKSILTEIEAQLALLALEQMMSVSEDNKPIIKKIKSVLKDEESRDRMSCIENRVITLCDPSRTLPAYWHSDKMIYEKCLRLMYTFDFLQLKEVLFDWNPQPEYIIKKIAILSLVDSDACKRMLTTDTLDSIPTRIERYRATQLANILSGELNGKFSVKEFSYLSSNDLFSLRDWFFEKSLRPKERLHSYGSTEDSSPVNLNNAIRSLQFLIESPAFVQMGMWSIVDNALWYKVAHMLFELYPYPVMFYSTTMNETNILRRIGQDFAYSSTIHRKLPGLVEKMFSLLVNPQVPLSYLGRRSYCVLLGELIKAVPPKHWNRYILQLWNDNNDALFENGDTNDELYKLICIAVSRTNDSLLVSSIIRDTLHKVRRKNKYGLAQNLFYYSRTKHSNKIAKMIEQSLTDFVSELCDIRDYILLGNLNRVITNKLAKRIAKSIPLILQKTENESISSINGLIFFAKQDDSILSHIRKAIITNPSLWNNGVHGNTCSQCDYLPIAEIDEQLKWTKDEVVQVFDRLVQSAQQILPEKDPVMARFMNREGLFGEMLLFIDLHRNDLSDIDYSNIYTQIDKKYKDLTSYVNIEQSIYSENDDAVQAALEALAKRIRHDGLKEHLDAINVLITRLLCKNKNAYQTILDYLQYYIRFFAKDKDTINIIPQLIPLMNSLTIDIFKELEQNVLVCSELTILISQHLEKFDVTSEGVKYWQNFKKSNFFNWSICDNTTN